MIERFLEHTSYVGIFVTLLLGALGAPIPEELPILTAAVLSNEEIIRWWIALPLCLAGVISGDVVLYWVGHRWGERVLGWRYVRRFLTPERERVLADRYRRHGWKIIVVARHVMGLRAAAFLTAGIVGLPFVTFLTVDAGAAVVGVSFSFLVGYLFTEHLTEILAGIHRVERYVVLGGLLAILAGALVWYRRQQRRLGLPRDDDAIPYGEDVTPRPP